MCSWIAVVPRSLDLRASNLSVAIYPTVMATTSRAPMSFGGLGTGTSNHRQAIPMDSPKSNPTTVLIMLRLRENVWHFSFMATGKTSDSAHARGHDYFKIES